MGLLIVLDGPNRGAVYPLPADGPAVVGRDPAVAVPLPDGTASRRHAELAFGDDAGGDAFCVRDLGSRNGTFVNALPCAGDRAVPLAAGDEIRIGETTLVFADVEPGAAATSVVDGSTHALPGPGAGAADRVVDGERPKPPRRRAEAPALVGESPAWLATLEMVALAAPHESSVLLRGESGTGKEGLAQALHLRSRRRDGPFVAVNCATLEGSLLLSELFGHERGAFTGASARRLGRLEQADGGTLLLDEIGELPPETQPKLLRVLEDRAVERVGGTVPVRADFRLVAATNRDLSAMVGDGAFREDLYHRIRVVEVAVPPLRDREGDVAVLVDHFIAELAARMGSPVRRFEPDALAALAAQRFPGNVRELRNLVERVLIFARGGESVGVDELPPEMRLSTDGARHAAPTSRLGVVPLRELERREVEKALVVAKGNKAEAARLLGIDRATLYPKIERLGLTDAAEAAKTARGEQP